MSTLNVDKIVDSSGGVFAPASSVFKNRIINGDCRIDQRNAGASVTPTTAGYTLDRWAVVLSVASKYSVQQNAGSVTPPVGFTNYLGVTSLSAYTVGATDQFGVVQRVEGFNTADLGWGTANAKTVTLSFWVYSSLTGTFGGAFRNASAGATRSYPFSYTITSANTWEHKTITVVGDTTGTWGVSNSLGLQLSFGLGVGSTFSNTAGAWAAGNFLSSTGATSVVGTNGATFYITGVQLEVGTQATSFEYRQYQQELALCHRYYYQHARGDTKTIGMGSFYASTYLITVFNLPVAMRVAPVMVATSGTDFYGVERNIGISLFSTFDGVVNTSETMVRLDRSTQVSGTAGQIGVVRTNNASASLAFSSEL
jgi:hypothetical protein